MCLGRSSNPGAFITSVTPSVEPDYELSIVVIEDLETGTIGPLRVREGITIEAADGSIHGVRNRVSPNKSFEVELCTVARWENGEITEERLFYDLVGLMKQIGLG